MHVDVATAIASMQSLVSRYESNNYWRAEQAEEALNILLLQPERQGNPRYLARNALADAAKKLKRRAAQTSDPELAPDWIKNQVTDGLEFLLIETADLLSRRLNPRDRALLAQAYRGISLDEMAQSLRLPIARIRERLSRARLRARTARESPVPGHECP
jgi:hypothetical protein